MRIDRVALSLLVLIALATMLAGCYHHVMHSHFDPSVSGYWQQSSSSRHPLQSGHTGRTTGDEAAATFSDEELWVIAKAPTGEAVAADAGADDLPGCGALVCMPNGPAAVETFVPVPLEHTEVEAHVAGFVASVTVRQRFHNPYGGKIEAAYVFPLPEVAAVSEFVMTIGERRIRGIVREREEAERIYREARSQGYVASLLTQERPNLFTQLVANIEPGKRIDVEITYFNALTYTDGWYEFVFPMVVGPRFNPPGSQGSIGAAPRGGSGASGQRTEVSYLRPRERSGHDISLQLTIDAGVEIEEIGSPTHRIEERAEGSTQRVVALAESDRIPNRDFVLRYRVGGDEPRGAVMVHRKDGEGYLALMLYPPRDLDWPEPAGGTEGTPGAEAVPLEMVFVVDVSGSMKGEPLARATSAVRHALRRLAPGDTFQLVAFASAVQTFDRRPVAATRENVERGLGWVESLRAGGGTMMASGLEAVLAAAVDQHGEPGLDAPRTRFIVFLTDGYIGNEAEVLALIEPRLGASRIFSFGIGSAPNRFLLAQMAKLGRGAVAYVGLDESAGEVMDSFIDRVRRPALTDVAIDWGALRVTDAYPSRAPDLFAGRALVVSARFDPTVTGTATVRVIGRVGAQAIEIPIEVDLDVASGGTNGHRGLDVVWARRRLADLSDEALRGGDPTIPEQILATALRYGLVSAYTAFIAVDASRRTDGEYGTTVPVAVPVPEGAQYETTVPQRGS